MAIHIDKSGQRYVQVEIEVPGTPEVVWEAVATEHGISSWFVPTEMEESEDGRPLVVTSHFGNDGSMDAIAFITEWEPPRRFAANSADLGPDAPPIVTEWSVEARSGSTCMVRVVHSIAAESDEWDEQLAGWEAGWPWFFHVLRLYLADFGGQPAEAFRAMGAAPEPAAEAWRSLATALGLADAGVGERCKSADGMPPLLGTVRKTGEAGHEFAALVRLDEPAAGILSAFAVPMMGQIFLVADFFFYGKMAAFAAGQWESRWQAWMNERFPISGEPEDD